jgi:pimeloyl-ACP methyl ester carboxylesterase
MQLKSLALIALTCSLATTVRAESFAKRVDIGGGRMMYIECYGSGSPTVLLISGTDTASDLWHAADQKGPTVYDDIQKTTRVCAYDRPGAPHLDQTFSRSDPVPQPTSPQNGVDDLNALLKAADVPGPYVLVAHSFSGTIARVFAYHRLECPAHRHRRTRCSARCPGRVERDLCCKREAALFPALGFHNTQRRLRDLSSGRRRRRAPN